MVRKLYSSSEERLAAIEGNDRTWIFALAITSALSFTAEGAMFLLIQLHLKELGAEPFVISLNATLVWLGLLIGSVLWGTLSDRCPRKPLLFILLVTSTLAIGILALPLPAPGVLSAVFLRALFITGLVPIAMAMVSRASSGHRRGKNLSYISSPRALGMALGTGIAGYLLEALGFRWSFLTFAFLPLLALPLLFSLPEGRTAGPRKRRSSSLRCLKERGLSGLYFGGILTEMGVLGSVSLIYVYMTLLRIPTGIMGIVGALGLAMATPGMLLFGWLADRVRRWVVIISGFGISALVPLIFIFARDAWGMAAGHLTLNLSFSALCMGSIALIGDLIPAERQGQMLGLFYSSLGLGGVVGPLVAGTIVSFLGFQGMFLTMVGIATLGFLVVLLRRPKSSTPARQ